MKALGPTLGATAVVSTRGADAGAMPVVATSLLAVLTGSMFDSRVHKLYGDKIAEQHSGGFIFPLALKDVRLALAEAEAAGVPMPSVSVLRGSLIAGIARG